MASNLDLQNFTFNGNEIQSITQIDIGYSLTNILNQIVTFRSGVTCKTQIGYWYPTGDVGRLMESCDDAEAWGNQPISVTLDPKFWHLKNKQCAVDMQGNAMSAGLLNNMPTSDFSRTDVARVITNMMIADLSVALWRFIFFSDTEETNVGASSGEQHITTGYDSALIDWTDGLFSKAQLFHYSASGTTKTYSHRDVAIAENDGTTKTAQAAITGANAYKYLCDLVIPSRPDSKAVVIANQPNAQILCTQTIYNALIQYYHAKTAEVGYMYLTSDKGLQIRGIPIIPCPMWDYWINRAFNCGSTWWMPHRMIFTPKNNIVVAINNQTVYDNLFVEYIAFDKIVRWLTDGLFDVKIQQPDYLLCAF